jgi:hypothetical protein
MPLRFLRFAALIADLHVRAIQPSSARHPAVACCDTSGALFRVVISAHLKAPAFSSPSMHPRPFIAVSMVGLLDCARERRLRISAEETMCRLILSPTHVDIAENCHKTFINL